MDELEIDETEARELPLFEFRPKVLKAKDLTLGEWRRLHQLFTFFELILARRCRCLFLREQGRSSDYVQKTLEISPRQYFRWCEWYRDGGLRGLLREYASAWRQCTRCECLLPSGRFGSLSMTICRGCDRRRKRLWRGTPEGRDAAAHWNASREHTEAVRRYRSSPKGRAMRRREHERRQLREIQAEEGWRGQEEAD